MAELTINGQGLALDKHGYLAQLSDWNEQVAAEFARLENISLTSAHWEVVYFVRQFYLEFNTSPAIRILVKAMAQQLVANQRVPGLAMAVVHNGRVLSARGYGITDVKAAEPVDSHTVFRLASLSKSFAGTLTGMPVSRVKRSPTWRRPSWPLSGLIQMVSVPFSKPWTLGGRVGRSSRSARIIVVFILRVSCGGWGASCGR